MQLSIIDLANFQGTGLAWGFNDNQILSQRVLLLFISGVVAFHGWLQLVAGEVAPHTGRDKQVSRLGEFT